MIYSLMEKIISLIGLAMLVDVFFLIIHFLLSSSGKSSKADQDLDDQFEVREEWKDFM